MSYILKRCGLAGGLQSFVQQCIFNGASHEQEPYGPRQEEKDRERDRVWEGSDGVVKREGNTRVKREKKGEREVQVRQAVIDCFFFFLSSWCRSGFLL